MPSSRDASPSEKGAQVALPSIMKGDSMTGFPNHNHEGIQFDRGETPLMPFETLGEGLDFVYARLKERNEGEIRQIMGDPLKQTYCVILFHCE